jgi:hypothetical protein
MVTQRYSRVAGSLSVAQHPLRRRVDNVEATLLAALIVMFLVASPVAAVLAGRAADAAALREQRAEQSWHTVSATLQQDASQGKIGLDGEWGAAFVIAQWRAPDGGVRHGEVAVALNARAGQRVTEWITSTGQLTRPKLTADDVRDRAGTAALAAIGSLAALIALAAIGVRVTAGRRRLAGWARAWRAADPRCSPQR